jgi:ABC-type Fe3+/spermidine/putrescine transport system ATPase subunit
VNGGGGTVEVADDLVLRIAALEGLAPGDDVDVAIRPENIRLAPSASATKGKPAAITDHVFLGNISEYYAKLPSGQVLRVQTHPLQHFDVGDTVAIEIDATQCSVFRRDRGDAAAS